MSSSEVLLWVTAALLSGWALWQITHHGPARVTSTIAWLSLAMVTVTFPLVREAPGSTPASVLALCSAGMFAVFVTNGKHLSRTEAFAILAMAGLSVSVAALVVLIAPGQIVPPATHNWLFGTRNALAAYGAAGLVVPLIRSILGILSERKKGLEIAHSVRRVMSPRPTLAVLTGACIVGGIWNLSTQAAIWHATSSDAWLLMLWLLVAAENVAAAECSDAPLAGWVHLTLAVGGAVVAALVLASMPLL